MYDRNAWNSLNISLCDAIRTPQEYYENVIEM